MLALLYMLCSGCVHTFQPLTTNFDATPSGTRSVRNDTKHLTVSYINILWDSNGIGDIARMHDLEEIYYADLETLRIMGVWTQQWVHVYGR